MSKHINLIKGNEMKYCDLIISKYNIVWGGLKVTASIVCVSNIFNCWGCFFIIIIQRGACQPRLCENQDE